MNMAAADIRQTIALMGKAIDALVLVDTDAENVGRVLDNAEEHARAALDDLHAALRLARRLP